MKIEDFEPDEQEFIRSYGLIGCGMGVLSAFGFMALSAFVGWLMFAR